MLIQAEHERANITHPRKAVSGVGKRPQPGVANAVDRFVQTIATVKLRALNAQMRIIRSDNADLMPEAHPFPRQVIRTVFHAVARRTGVMIDVENPHVDTLFPGGRRPDVGWC